MRSLSTILASLLLAGTVLAARALTARESAVLSFIVVDAQDWWDHANEAGNVDAERALAAKVAKWGPKYDRAIFVADSLGMRYYTRAQADSVNVRAKAGDAGARALQDSIALQRR